MGKMETKTLTYATAETFRELVVRSPLPVLVDFYADWCGPCRYVAPIVEELSRKFDGRMRFVKVDVDANPELAERFGIESIPTLMIFKDGNVVTRRIGALPKVALEHEIEHILNGSSH